MQLLTRIMQQELGDSILSHLEVLKVHQETRMFEKVAMTYQEASELNIFVILDAWKTYPRVTGDRNESIRSH